MLSGTDNNIILIALALPMGMAATMAFQQWMTGSTLYNKVTGVGKYVSITFVLARFALLAGEGMGSSGYPVFFIPAVLALGPFVFFFYKGLLFDPRPQWQSLGLHLVPTAGAQVLEIGLILVVGLDVLDAYFAENFTIPLRGLLLYGTAFLFLHMVLYAATMTYYQLRQWSQKELRPVLRFLLSGNSLGLVTYIVIFCGFVFGLPALWALGGSLLVICFAGMLMLDNREPKFFAALGQAHRRTEYAKAALAGVAMDQMVDRLKALMEVDKLYRKMELSLNEVAGELSVKPKQLSGLLNSHMGLNFFQFVNSYRVEEAKEILRAEPDRNILAVCYDVGFNSKAVFYRAFKQKAGVTPSEFRQQAVSI